MVYPQFMKLKSKRYLDQEVKAWRFRCVKSSSPIEEAKTRSNRKRREEKEKNPSSRVWRRRRRKWEEEIGYELQREKRQKQRRERERVPQVFLLVFSFLFPFFFFVFILFLIIFITMTGEELFPVCTHTILPSAGPSAVVEIIAPTSNCRPPPWLLQGFYPTFTRRLCRWMFLVFLPFIAFFLTLLFLNINFTLNFLLLFFFFNYDNNDN